MRVWLRGVEEVDDQGNRVGGDGGRSPNRVGGMADGRRQWRDGMDGNTRAMAK